MLHIPTIGRDRDSIEWLCLRPTPMTTGEYGWTCKHLMHFRLCIAFLIGYSTACTARTTLELQSHSQWLMYVASLQKEVRFVSIVAGIFRTIFHVTRLAYSQQLSCMTTSTAAVTMILIVRFISLDQGNVFEISHNSHVVDANHKQVIVFVSFRSKYFFWGFKLIGISFYTMFVTKTNQFP